MKILDVELRDIDFNDADDLELFENAVENAKKVLDNLNPDGKRASEVIRKGCNAIFECFDKIFGEGTAKKVFGDKTSLKICIEAFRDLKSESKKQDAEIQDMVAELNDDYKPNRATRRANAKKANR